MQIISPTTLFLAAKVEEQPRKLEHVIKVAHACLNPQESPLDTKSNVSMGVSVKCMVESFCQWSRFPYVCFVQRALFFGPGLQLVCIKHLHLPRLALVVI